MLAEVVANSRPTEVANNIVKVAACIVITVHTFAIIEVLIEVANLKMFSNNFKEQEELMQLGNYQELANVDDITAAIQVVVNTHCLDLNQMFTPLAEYFSYPQLNG